MKTSQIVSATGPRRRALCIGIDAYTRAPLRGAVSDAERWARVMKGRGFSITLLLDAEATRARVLEELWRHVDEAQGGDRIAVAFAGHGTRDVGYTEDTAIVCADAEYGGIVLDDEIGEVMGEIREGVGVTLFFDCCHSGTMSRSVGSGQRMTHAAPQVRQMAGDRSIREAFATLPRRKRRRLLGKLGRALGAALVMREVCIAACGDRELAYEVGDAGVFTAAATALLAERPDSAWTNERFVAALEGRMREVSAQRPRLTCAPWRRGEVLLGERGGVRAA